MRRTFQILAAMLLVGTAATRLAAGANRGWTRTSTPIKFTDEVTGIEGIQYRKQFEPGLDFLAAAFIAAGGLATTSLFLKKPKQSS